MADNSVADPGSGGDSFRTKDIGGIKTPISIIDIGGGVSENLLLAGQQLATNSIPVVLTAEQVSTLTPLASVTVLQGGVTPWICNVTNQVDVVGDVGATQSGTWNITDISGTISLPTGASTEATLSSINGKITAVDTGAVVIASSALPTGASTLVEQQSQTTQLGRIAGKYVDFDTGAGTDSVVALGILLPGNGGAVIGGTTTNPFQVTFSNTTIAVTNTGTFAVQEGNSTAIAASLNTIDDWDEIDRCKVNPIAGQAGVAAGSGVVDALTQRVVLATDVALPAGTNAIGKLAANSGVTIGAVEIAAAQTLATLTTLTGGGVASGAADSGNPHKIGGKYNLVKPTLTDGQRGDAQLDSRGMLLVSLYNPDTGTAASYLPDNADGVSTNAGANRAVTMSRLTVWNGSTWDRLRGDTTGGAWTQGAVAHDAADSSNPHKIGAKATTSLSGLTLVANADRTDLYAGIDGAQITRPHSNLEDIVSGNASNTDGTSTACIAAQAAGIKTYLTTIILTNTSSSNIYVEIKDGATTKLTIPVPANGGAVCNLPVPLGGTAATAWNFDASAATTTLYCSMIGFKSKI